MIKFKKGYNLKLAVVTVNIFFLFTGALYPLSISKDTLRVQAGQEKTYQRITEIIKTFEEQESRIDLYIKTAHKEGRVSNLYVEFPEIVNDVHRFLQENGLGETVALFEGLQEEAQIKEDGWDKGGLWLVTPKKGEELPLEHVSDRGGIHFVKFPGIGPKRLARAYAHAMAAYIGFSHEKAEAFEKAFVKWQREKQSVIILELQKEFLEKSLERKITPDLLTKLSEKEKEGFYQRDYTKPGDKIPRRKFFKIVFGAVVLTMVSGVGKAITSPVLMQTTASEIPPYAYSFTMGQSFSIRGVGDYTAQWINDNPYFPSTPLLGFGAGTISPSDNGTITRNHMDAGKHKYDTAGPPIFYIKTGSGQSYLPLTNGTFWMAYPKSGYIFDTKETPVKLTTTQFSPIISHNYKETSLPIGIFKISAANTTKNKESVTVKMPFENFTRLVGWGNNEIAIRKETTEDGVTGVVIDNKEWDKKGWKGQIALALLSDGVQIDIADGAISITMALKPGQKLEVPIALAMDFPNAVLDGGQNILRYYTKFFGDSGKNSWKLASHGARKAEEWESEIDRFQKSITGDPNIPDEIKKLIFNELAYLADGGTLWDAKTNWFAYLETYDYPFYNTSDVFFYGGMALLKFWPDLSKNIVRQFARGVIYEDLSSVKYDNTFLNDKGERKESDSHKPGGAAIHDVGAPYSGIGINKVNAYRYQNCNYWEDLNSKFALMAYREYYLTGSNDEKFLQDMWPAVKIALNYQRRRMVSEGDVLPVHSGFPDQTYDTLPMKGVSSYTGSLWLAALEAGIKMAEKLGHNAEAQQYRQWLEEGKKGFEKKLWDENKGYYRLDENTEDVVFADQLVGAWYAELLNLEPIVPTLHLEKALKAVYKYNFLNFERGKRGIVNAIHENGKVYGTQQGKEVWVGVAYAIADFMWRKGMKKESTEVLISISNTLGEFGLVGRTPEAYTADRTARAPMYMRAGSIGAFMIHGPESHVPTEVALLKDQIKEDESLPTIQLLKPTSTRKDFWPGVNETWIKDSGNELNLEIGRSSWGSGKAMNVSWQHNNEAWIGCGFVEGTTNAEITHPEKMALKFTISGDLGTTKLNIIFEDQWLNERGTGNEITVENPTALRMSNPVEVEIPLPQDNKFDWKKFKQVKLQVIGRGSGNVSISNLRIESKARSLNIKGGAFGVLPFLGDKNPLVTDTSL